MQEEKESKKRRRRKKGSVDICHADTIVTLCLSAHRVEANWIVFLHSSSSRYCCGRVHVGIRVLAEPEPML